DRLVGPADLLGGGLQVVQGPHADGQGLEVVRRHDQRLGFLGHGCCSLVRGTPRRAFPTAGAALPCRNGLRAVPPPPGTPRRAFPTAGAALPCRRNRLRAVPPPPTAGAALPCRERPPCRSAPTRNATEGVPYSRGRVAL